MHHDEIALGDHPPELDVLAGIFAGGLFEIVDEALLPAGDAGIVLDVIGADIALDRLARTPLIEHQVIEFRDRPLVALEPLVHCALPTS